MRRVIVSHSNSNSNLKPYKESKIKKMARKFLEDLGLPGLAVFEYDNWPEIITAAFTDPDKEYPEPLSRFNNRSAERFQKTGYKYSIVFQKLIKAGGGEFRPMVI